MYFIFLSWPWIKLVIWMLIFRMWLQMHGVYFGHIGAVGAQAIFFFLFSESNPFTWELCQISALLLTCRCLCLSSSVQFVLARLLVCSELQIRPRSFIQNQMRVWQRLHLRHFSAHQLGLGKSPPSRGKCEPVWSRLFFVRFGFFVQYMWLCVFVWLRWGCCFAVADIVVLMLRCLFVSAQVMLFFYIDWKKIADQRVDAMEFRLRFT